ncbi:MAG: hypothetical protein IJR55_04160 [Clostridia bacterium]|nr:hypothetical protein [Clostridia bacterium]
MKLKEKIENYWYHYKWPTIIVAFFVVVAAVLVAQLFQKQKYDAFVMYVGDKEITQTQYTDIVTSLKTLAPDATNDGVITVNFSKLAYITDPEKAFYSQINVSAKEQLASMVVLPYYIYIMPREIYNEYKDSGVFEKLSEIYGKAVPSSAEDEYAINYNKTYFAQNCAGGEGFGDDVVIVMKIVPYSNNKRTLKKEQASYDAHLELFKKMVGN